MHRSTGGNSFRAGNGRSAMHSAPRHSVSTTGRALLLVLGLLIMLSCWQFDPLDPSGLEADRARWTQYAAESTRFAVERTSWASYNATFDALATLQAQLHIAQTEEAAYDAAPPAAPQVDAPPAPAPPEAQGGHSPTILNVDIARQVPANGTKVGGTIIFEDAAQDVVLLRADVLAATLHAESWSYDPRQNMVWSGNRGIAAFQVWCTGDPQDVSYSLTLQDSAGNVSPSWQVDYT